MEVIPVIDLKAGVVVHARMGRRDEYRAIETPLARSSNPLDVARGLRSVFPFRTFYVADLDAILGEGDNDAALSQLQAELPDAVFWVDAGIADAAAAELRLRAASTHVVLGSESQKDGALVRRFSRHRRVVLSLDYRAGGFVGPAALLEDADSWPERVIVMTLARVGSADGPDIPRLAAIRARASGRSVYAAGGVRDADDLAALKRAGMAGVLVATSLHRKTLAGAQIARLQAT